ncbi:hypothetical protein Desti_0580 [Desulfomonile tiedjei DSM 6799]|uniref:Uncharacterized protein n=1 Tax=Desulfomonile tiedjei (strain ATCC 49306 / DSM 6799 / DCB-1) TaxID=706587 RepID=I4C170_DESTA|nr:hypothetical protein Desti_0580 [Desulfomonile tiedjei DSM 6799]
MSLKFQLVSKESVLIVLTWMRGSKIIRVATGVPANGKE